MAPHNRTNRKGSKADAAFESLDNLTEAVSEERNWKSIAVALLVIVLICTLIVVAIILTTPKTDAKNYGRQMSFDDIFNSSFQTFDIRPQWIGDVLCYRSRNGSLMSIDPATNVTKVLLNTNYFNEKGVTEYSVSGNQKYVVVKWKVVPKYRHSSEAVYTVYDVRSKTSKNIVPPGYSSTAEISLQLFQWSSSSDSDALVFVYQNNIYYKPSAFSEQSTQITSNGLDSKIFNGIPDWLYEEEIISSNNMLWWSANSSLLAYASINDSQCTAFQMARYKNASQVYPITEFIPYPKAGEVRDDNIPAVLIRVHNLDTNSTLRTFLAPDELKTNTDYLFTGAVWFDDDALLIEWSNREQTKSLAYVCLVSTGTCTLSLQVKSTGIIIGATELNGWVDTNGRRFFPVSAVGSQNYPYVTTTLHTTQRQSNMDVYRQVTFVGGVAQVAGAMPRSTILSTGSEVDTILFVDNVRRIAYYLAPRDDDPRTAHVFASKWNDVDGGADLLGERCLTCSLNETCDVAAARFSKSGTYYVLQCSGPAIPSTILRNVDNNYELVLEDNQPLKELLETVKMPKVTYQELTLEDGRKVDAEIMLPPSLNEQHFITHPLLLYVYGGPESRSVMKRWKSVGWMHFLSTEHNVVIAAVDGRGSGGRGRQNAYWLYKALGTHEIRDQILAVQALKKLPYVDKAKVAVQGSSYGGYATLHLLANASDIIPCGISLAPVTDWIFYDTAYTERYMGLYKDNLIAYNRASVLQPSRIQGIKSGVLLLAHGTADHNVHLQQSLQLIKLLSEAEAQFDLQIYTDMEHNLRIGASGRQLTRRMINFLEDCYNNKTAARVAPEGFSKFDEDVE